MLKIGPYREIYEVHLKQFLSYGYPQIDAAALAQTVVARPLPESALTYKAGFLEAILPQAAMILEFNQYEGVSLKVQQAVQENSSLFTDADDPANPLILVSGVYPDLVVLKVQDNGCWYAADLAFVFQRED